jgi:hypothetical protein
MAQHSVWIEAARQLKAQRVDNAGGVLQLRAQMQGLPVVFLLDPDTHGVVVRVGHEGAFGRLLPNETLPDWPGPRTGDALFDAGVRVLGDASLLLQLPDVARAPLLRLIDRGARVERGQVVLPTRLVPTDAADATALLSNAVAACVGFAAPNADDIVHRALTDSAPEVRAFATQQVLEGQARPRTGRVLDLLERHRPANLADWLHTLRPSTAAHAQRWLALAEQVRDPRLNALRLDLAVHFESSDANALDNIAARVAQQLADGVAPAVMGGVLAEVRARPRLEQAVIKALRAKPSAAGTRWLVARIEEVGVGAVPTVSTDLEGFFEAINTLVELDEARAIVVLGGLRPASRSMARAVVSRLVRIGVDQTAASLVWWLTERWQHVGDLVGKPVARALGGWLSEHPDGGPAAVLSGRRLPRDFLDEVVERLAKAPPTDGARWVLGLVYDTDGQRRRIAVTLGGIGDPVAESWLVAALDGLPALRIAAANALARCGSLAALPALEPHTGGLFTDGAVKAAARAACAAIEARGSQSRGGLSVIEQQGGDLSLID